MRWLCGLFVVVKSMSEHECPAAGSSPVVDAHLHVWSGDWPYAAGQAPPADALDGAGRVGSAVALSHHMSEHGVARALIVQPINYAYDHSYVAHCLASWPHRFRGMALADPTLSPAEAVAKLRAVVGTAGATAGNVGAAPGTAGGIGDAAIGLPPGLPWGS